MKRLATATCLAALVFILGSSAAQTKPILIGVKVEAEDSGKGQGMWTQAATDLTPQELKTLESLVVAGIKKQEGVKIVSLDYPENYIGIVVVAAKLRNGGTEKRNYIGSCVVLIATKKGIDELVTHEVIAESNLASLARTIGYQFAVVKFRAAPGLWK